MSLNNTSLIDFAKLLLSSLKDRQEILRILVARLINDFNVEHGSIWSVEGNYVVPLFSLNQQGVEDEISAAIQDLRIPLGEGYVGRAAKEGVPNFDNFPQNDPRHFDKVDEATKHTTTNIISIPLNRENKTIGVVQLLDKVQGGPFSEEDQTKLMQHYAPWATIALDNANLYAELQETTEFGRQLLFSTDRKQILQHLITKLITDFHVERGSIWSVEGSYVVPLFSLNQQGVEDEISAAVQDLRIPLGEGYVGRAAQEGSPNFDNFPQNDPRHFHKVDEATKHITRNIISIPLNRENKTIGVIQLLDKVESDLFTEEDQMKLMHHYAPWATIALDNANLYAEAEGLAAATVHNMGNVLGDARAKLRFLQDDLDIFINSVRDSLTTFHKNVGNEIKVVDNNIYQSIELVNAHLSVYKEGSKELVHPKDLVALAINQLPTKQFIHIKNNVSSNLPKILFAKQDFIAHFLELLTNATKAIEDGIANNEIENGIITITSELTKKNTLILRFTNNGSRIPEEYWGIIFDKHISMRTNKSKKSFGLGLWVARKFFERQGGSIEIENSSTENTTFLVTLPVHQTKEAKSI